VNKMDALFKYIFKIGDVVQVRAVVTFENKYDYSGDIYRTPIVYREMVRKEFKNYFLAQIVGAKHKMVGQILDHNSEDGAYFQVESSIFVWEVKRGLLNKVEYALPEDIWFALTNTSWKVPIVVQNRYSWNDKDRAELRDQMKNVKRDKKGRWI